MTESTDVVTTEETPTALVPPSAYGELAGVGLEGGDAGEIAMPFIQILQGLSPVVQDPSRPDAVAGKLYNSVTGDVYNDIYFVPCHRDHTFVEWKPRNQGGGGGAGFVAVHQPGADIVVDAITAQRYKVKDGRKTRTLLTADGNELVETRTFSGLLVDSDTPTEAVLPVVIPFTSGKIAQFRGAMTAIRTVKGRPPLFANVLHFQTTLKKYPDGDSFVYNIRLLKDKQLPAPAADGTMHPVLSEALALSKMIQAGQATADHASQTTADNTADGDDSSHF